MPDILAVAERWVESMVWLLSEWLSGLAVAHPVVRRCCWMTCAHLFYLGGAVLTLHEHFLSELCHASIHTFWGNFCTHIRKVILLASGGNKLYEFCNKLPRSNLWFLYICLPHFSKEMWYFYYFTRGINFTIPQVSYILGLLLLHIIFPNIGQRWGRKEIT